MRRPIVALALVILATPALARPDTRSMSCDQARELVYSQGAIVLDTGPHTYRRFVANAGFCRLGEYAYETWAPTNDGRCQLGFVCRTDPPLDPLFDLPGIR